MNKSSLKHHSDTLVASKGRRYPIQSWIPKGALAQVFLVHGFSEYTGWYEETIQELVNQGLAVHALDLIGHGNADGMRGHIYNFEEFVFQLKQFVEQNPFALKKTPSFILAHSMGGLISLLYAQEFQPKIQGLILTNPLLGFETHHWWIKQFVSRVTHDNPYKLWLKPLGHEGLVRTQAGLDRLNADKLRLKVTTPKMYLQMHAWTQYMCQQAKNIHLPLLLFLSYEDKVVDERRTKEFFHQIASQDKKLVAYTQARHEILQEPEMKQIVNIISGWCKARL